MLSIENRNGKTMEKQNVKKYFFPNLLYDPHLYWGGWFLSFNHVFDLATKRVNTQILICKLIWLLYVIYHRIGDG